MKAIKAIGSFRRLTTVGVSKCNLLKLYPMPFNTKFYSTQIKRMTTWSTDQVCIAMKEKKTFGGASLRSKEVTLLEQANFDGYCIEKVITHLSQLPHNYAAKELANNLGGRLLSEKEVEKLAMKITDWIAQKMNAIEYPINLDGFQEWSTERTYLVLGTKKDLDGAGLTIKEVETVKGLKIDGQHLKKTCRTIENEGHDVAVQTLRNMLNSDSKKVSKKVCEKIVDWVKEHFIDGSNWPDIQPSGGNRNNGKSTGSTGETSVETDGDWGIDIDFDL